MVLAVVHLGGWRDPESEEDFERLVVRAERLAEEGLWGDDDEDDEEADEDEPLPVTEDEDFKALVRSAIDDLPLEFHRALEHVAIVVSDGGRRHRAYGLYQGDTVARDFFHDRIVIFKDTLLRDFGHDPELLKAQVTRTVRHELAHHLGWGEKGVAARPLGPLRRIDVFPRPPRRSSQMPEAVIVDAIRTPIGRAGKGLAEDRAGRRAGGDPDPRADARATRRSTSPRPTTC